jgi:hypothetical protein
MNKILILVIIFFVSACSSGPYMSAKKSIEEKSVLTTNQNGTGPEIVIDFTRGKYFYYPLFAIWLEDADGKYIQTLYVAKSVATGIFRYGTQENKKWITAPKRAPQTLPYWSHKRGIIASDGLYMPDEKTMVNDAYTGATPANGFILRSKANHPLPGKFRVMMEINQNWDWNDYWTNDKFPDDEDYKMSCQPAVVYETVVDALQATKKEYLMNPIGHSHYSGKSGELFTDLSTLTTALQIADSVKVMIR